MTREELLNGAIRRFKIIVEDTKRITAANLSHNLTCLRGRAIRAYEILEKHKKECFDEWHKESEESIYDAITDWTVHKFVCIMKNSEIVEFIGVRAVNFDGETAVAFRNVGECEVDINDIIMWIEIPKLND